MSPRRILVVDDLKMWRDALSRMLRPEGFEVDTAASREEAEEKLLSGLYHLLILDIRMQEEDAVNEDGLDFLRDLRRFEGNDAIPVIVVSAHGRRDQMREAFRQHGVVDFFSKRDFDNLELLTEVRNLFDRRMAINFALRIDWQDGAAAGSAVAGLHLAELPSRQGLPGPAVLLEELEDLLARLFHDTPGIEVRPWGSGLDQTGMLRVQPIEEAGEGHEVVVKLGDFRQIDREISRFERFVEPFAEGGRGTRLYGRRTLRLGGVVYSPHGMAGGRCEDFAAFYRRTEAPEICKVLDRLFSDTCGAWYRNPGPRQPLNLTRHYMELYEMTSEGLREHSEALRDVQGRERLHFAALGGGRTFRNPIPTLADRPLVLLTQETVTHGDLDEDNILLDGRGSSWLVGFQATGPGPILRDVTQLETAVRIRLLKPEDATLQERLALEESLSPADELSRLDLLAPPQGANPAVAKAFAVCLHLRGLAGRLPGSPGDPGELYAGALYTGLNLIRHRRLPALQREHALLSACLLAEHLAF